MNILITLRDCDPTQVDALVDAVVASVQTAGFSVDIQPQSPSLSVVTCSFNAKATCATCGCEQCACDSAPSLTDMPADVEEIPSEQLPAEEPQNAVEFPPEPPAEISTDSVPVVPMPSIGSCRILNLSTTLGVSVQIDPQLDNTSLKATNVSTENGIVRFTFNNFQHALPLHVDDSGRDSALVNSSSHGYSQNTVRLVIDFDGKTYPALVDIEEGSEHALIVGQDLLQIIGGQDVPRE